MNTMTQPRTGDCNRFASAYSAACPEEAIRQEVLIERCKAGVPGAWDTLIRHYQGPIRKFAYTLCHNYEEAGDIAGQVFLRLYQNLHTFRNEASFTSWIFRIVRNTYVDQCLRSPHQGHLRLDASPSLFSESSAGREVLDPAPSPETICLENDTIQRLTSAIRHLPVYQSQVMRMHIEDRSYKEIAEALGISIGTVKSRLNRARAMLLQRLAPGQETLKIA